ncbi:MAG: hypothetical protein R2862_08145 [Thermoanaerobaculia bacterium]
MGFLLVFGIALGGLLVVAGTKMAKGRHLRFCIFASVLGSLRAVRHHARARHPAAALPAGEPALFSD